MYSDKLGAVVICGLVSSWAWVWPRVRARVKRSGRSIVCILHACFVLDVLWGYLTEKVLQEYGSTDYSQEN